MLSAAEDGEVAGGVNSPPTPTKKPKRKGSRREKERMAVVPAAVGTDATPAGALLHLPASHTDARDEKLEEAKAKKEKKSAAAHKRQKSKGGGGGSNLCTTSTSSAVLPIQSNTSSAPALHVCRREKLVEELLSSERAHVHNLNAFLHDYVIPLRDKKILSTDELQGILCNLELIRRWNVEFLNQLESALEDERGFGELFLEMVLPSCSPLVFAPGLLPLTICSSMVDVMIASVADVATTVRTVQRELCPRHGPLREMQEEQGVCCLHRGASTLSSLVCVVSSAHHLLGQCTCVVASDNRA